MRVGFLFAGLFLVLLQLLLRFPAAFGYGAGIARRQVLVLVVTVAVSVPHEGIVAQSRVAEKRVPAPCGTAQSLRPASSFAAAVPLAPEQFLVYVPKMSLLFTPIRKAMQSAAISTPRVVL
jgi:hypothetical protein